MPQATVELDSLTPRARKKRIDFTSQLRVHAQAHTFQPEAKSAIIIFQLKQTGWKPVLLAATMVFNVARPSVHMTVFLVPIA
jgi:hypothetical protein